MTIAEALAILEANIEAGKLELAAAIASKGGSVAATAHLIAMAEAVRNLRLGEGGGEKPDLLALLPITAANKGYAHAGLATTFTEAEFTPSEASGDLLETDSINAEGPPVYIEPFADRPWVIRTRGGGVGEANGDYFKDDRTGDPTLYTNPDTGMILKGVGAVYQNLNGETVLYATAGEFENDDPVTGRVWSAVEGVGEASRKKVLSALEIAARSRIVVLNGSSFGGEYVLEGYPSPAADPWQPRVWRNGEYSIEINTTHYDRPYWVFRDQAPLGLRALVEGNPWDCNWNMEDGTATNVRLYNPSEGLTSTSSGSPEMIVLRGAGTPEIDGVYTRIISSDWQTPITSDEGTVLGYQYQTETYVKEQYFVRILGNTWKKTSELQIGFHSDDPSVPPELNGQVVSYVHYWTSEARDWLPVPIPLGVANFWTVVNNATAPAPAVTR